MAGQVRLEDKLEVAAEALECFEVVRHVDAANVGLKFILFVKLFLAKDAASPSPASSNTDSFELEGVDRNRGVAQEYPVLKILGTTFERIISRKL